MVSTQVDCLTAFSKASQEVMEQVLDQPVQVEPPYQVSQPVEVMEVSVILGLTGDLEGRVLFEFSRQDALGIATAMNFGEEFPELDQMARATLCELGNLVAGRALTTFNDDGGNLNLSPPMLMCGLGMRASDQSPVSKFRVDSASGQMFVNLSVRPALKMTTRGNGKVRGGQS